MKAAFHLVSEANPHILNPMSHHPALTSRRGFLRGLGAAVGLPALDVFRPLMAAEAGARIRNSIVAFDDWRHGRLEKTWRDACSKHASSSPIQSAGSGPSSNSVSSSTSSLRAPISNSSMPAQTLAP